MKVAVCFSGQLRSIDLTQKNIRKFLDEKFDDYKIFAHIPKDTFSENFSSYFPNSIILIEDDPVIRRTKLKNKQFTSVESKFTNLKAAKFAHMQQLYGIYMSNNLKIDYEKKNNFTFDWVLRTRTDLKFYPGDLKLESLDDKYIYTPNFHHWKGINDRFVLGNSLNMDIFANLYSFIKKNRVSGFNAENIFRNYLNHHNIPLQQLDNVKFNRIRGDGKEMQDF
jgi:hypothetical protein